MTELQWNLTVPDWLAGQARELRPLSELPQRMARVIEWSAENVRRGTGGPFAAGVFQRDTGRLIAPGVNLVLPSGASIAHAEIVALTLAQQALGVHDLAARGRYELLSTTDPCAMCLGAIPWSGVKRLVCAADEADAEAIGFDEGDKPADWPGQLRRRGIEVMRGICREQAADVLKRYAQAGGAIYNSAGTLETSSENPAEPSAN